METKYTSGPLQALNNNVVTKEGRTVATIFDPHAMTQMTEESKATTQLFAAAPELYEALVAVVSAFCAHAAPGSESMKQASAALAKARGEA